MKKAKINKYLQILAEGLAERDPAVTTVSRLFKLEQLMEDIRQLLTQRQPDYTTVNELTLRLASAILVVNGLLLFKTGEDEERFRRVTQAKDKDQLVTALHELDPPDPQQGPAEKVAYALRGLEDAVIDILLKLLESRQ